MQKNIQKLLAKLQGNFEYSTLQEKQEGIEEGY